MKNVFGLIINLAMAYCVWLAVNGSVGATHATVFSAILTAVCFIPAVCSISSQTDKAAPVFEYFTRIIDVFIIAVCAWLGWYWCAAAFFLGLVSSEAIYAQRAKNK